MIVCREAFCFYALRFIAYQVFLYWKHPYPIATSYVRPSVQIYDLQKCIT